MKKSGTVEAYYVPSTKVGILEETVIFESSQLIKTLGRSSERVKTRNKHFLPFMILKTYLSYLVT